MLAIGIIAGYFISRSVGYNLAHRQHAAERNKQAESAAAVAGFRRGASDADMAKLRQWPDPSSPQALQLLQDPDGPDGEHNISSAALCQTCY
jgi:hypothetical protein